MPICTIRPLRHRSLALSCLAVLWICTAAGPVRAELRPLVRDMLENLGSIDQIGEGVALEEYDRVISAAGDLLGRAERMKQEDLSVLGLNPDRDVEWDAYLAAQQQGARAILAAAEQEDARNVFLGVEQISRDACLACHAGFRAPANLLRPSVLFMTTLLSAWREMNRALMLNDFSLVTRRAREIQAMGRVLSWDQVIQTTFGLDDAAERKTFRRLLHRINSHAATIEQAAAEEDGARIVEALRSTWTEGCIACHEQFR